LLRGPNLKSVDAGFAKNIPIGERLHFQLRAEFFNFFNRANFTTRTARSAEVASGLSVPLPIRESGNWRSSCFLGRMNLHCESDCGDAIRMLFSESYLLKSEKNC